MTRARQSDPSHVLLHPEYFGRGVAKGRFFTLLE
jgi:hypothetical protein